MNKWRLLLYKMTDTSRIIYLDVGGTKFSTSLETLLKYPTSMLGLMFNGNFESTQDNEGRYFIDADGEMFMYILNFLRRNQLCLPEHFSEYDRLLVEAEYFQIEPLVEHIRKIKQKRQTVLLCLITKGSSSVIDKKVYIAHFQSYNTYQTNHIPTDYTVYKQFLKNQGYTILYEPRRIESTGEWLLSMLSQGFLTNPVTPYEKNVLGRFDTYEVWSK